MHRCVCYQCFWQNRLPVERLHRGKKANTAITIIARPIAQIAWEILNQQRAYRNDIKSKPLTGMKTDPIHESACTSGWNPR